MKIKVNSMTSRFEYFLMRVDGPYEYNLANSITASIELSAGGEEYRLDEVPLIEFYTDLKERFFDALIGSKESRIRADFEDLFTLRPANSGCFISAQFPDKESGFTNGQQNILTLNDIRDIFLFLEGIIREELLEYRNNMLNIFNINQSMVLFQLLKIIDNSTSINNSH